MTTWSNFATRTVLPPRPEIRWISSLNDQHSLCRREKAHSTVYTACGTPAHSHMGAWHYHHMHHERRRETWHKRIRAHDLRLVPLHRMMLSHDHAIRCSRGSCRPNTLCQRFPPRRSWLHVVVITRPCAMRWRPAGV